MFLIKLHSSYDCLVSRVDLETAQIQQLRDAEPQEKNVGLNRLQRESKVYMNYIILLSDLYTVHSIYTGSR